MVPLNKVEPALVGEGDTETAEPILRSSVFQRQVSQREQWTICAATRQIAWLDLISRTVA